MSQPSNPNPASKNLSIDRIIGIQSPDEFHLAPDGNSVAYTLDCGGQRQVHIRDLAGGWPRRLTVIRQDCSEPQLAPHSAEVAFLRDNGLWVIDSNGGPERRLLKVRAGIRRPRWSPDGRQIAFYARLRGWDQIWLIDAAGGTPRLLTPEPADYEHLSWSPDGKRIAYTRLRADLRGRELWVVEVASGTARCLSDPASSELIEAPTWTVDGQEVIYLSDLGGWTHVWAVSLEQAEPRQLTDGSYEDGLSTSGDEVQPFCSPDGRLVAFLRHRDGCFDLMTAPLIGGPAQQVSQGDGVYRIVGWLPDSARLLATFESTAAPPDLWQISLDGTSCQLTFSLGGGIDPTALPLVERVSYPSEDGLTIPATLYRPRELAPGNRLPAVVNPHGGPTWQHTRYWNPFVALLVQEGYIVIAPDFRGSTGYGVAFRDANIGVWGTKDTCDVVRAVDYLRSRADIDGERIGIFGGSYGGYMVLCALTRYPKAFVCGVDLFGDSEIADSFHHGDRAGRQDLQRMMGRPEENPEAYRQGSPVYLAEHIQAPLLLLHGRDDMRVVPLMSEKMIQALKIEGKYHEAKFYDAEGHGFDKPDNRKDVYKRILKFLNTFLKGEDGDDE